MCWVNSEHPFIVFIALRQEERKAADNKIKKIKLHAKAKLTSLNKHLEEMKAQGGAASPTSTEPQPAEPLTKVRELDRDLVSSEPGALPQHIFSGEMVHQKCCPSLRACGLLGPKATLGQQRHTEMWARVVSCYPDSSETLKGLTGRSEHWSETERRSISFVDEFDYWLEH